MSRYLILISSSLSPKQGHGPHYGRLGIIREWFSMHIYFLLQKSFASVVWQAPVPCPSHGVFSEKGSCNRLSDERWSQFCLVFHCPESFHRHIINALDVINVVDSSDVIYMFQYSWNNPESVMGFPSCNLFTVADLFNIIWRVTWISYFFFYIVVDDKNRQVRWEVGENIM